MGRVWSVGIRGRLLLAFSAVAGLSLLGAAAGWIGFTAVEDANYKVTEQAVPALTSAARISEISAPVVSQLPNLGRSVNVGELQGLAADLNRERGALEDLIGELHGQGIDRAVQDSLRDTVAKLFQAVDKQQALVVQRFGLVANFDRNLAESLGFADQIVELSRTPVENASTQSMAALVGVYDLIEDGSSKEPAYQALDQIAEENLDQLERMTQLRLLASRVGQLLNRLSREISPAEIARLMNRFRDTWTIMERRLRYADDPGRREAMQEPLRVLRTHTRAGAADNLFDLRIRILSADLRIAALAARGAAQGRLLTDQVKSVSASSKTLIDGAVARSEATIGGGRTALIAVAAVSLAASGLILLLYVQGNLLRRLGRLHDGMTRLADGRLDSTIEDTGRDELRAMASTLEVFRQTALARRQLEEETKAANTQLQRYQNELEQLVEERTAQLTDANRRLEEEALRLQQARDEAEAADRAKSVFLATMSHEIRTPMNGVLGTAALLRQTEISAEQETYVSTIAESGHVLLRILNDILDYSKIEAGRLTFERVDFSLPVMVQRLLLLFEPEAERKGLLFGCEVAPEIPDSLAGDSARIQQVLFNLIGNAIKFTEEGEVYLTVDAEPLPGQRVWHLRFEVADSGIGIAEDKRARLFDAFSQAEDSTSRLYGGTGLGLAICDRLVRGMGGEIGADSRLGHGSQFWFTLDLPEGAPLRQADETEQPGTLAPMTVQLAEDTEVNRLVARTMLEKIGHRVIEAVNGAEAVDKAVTEKPDLVLMDISMPVMDGPTAARTLRTQADPEVASTPIVAMTAHVIGKDVEQFFDAGMNGFIGKPYEPADLINAMRAALEGSAEIPEQRAEPEAVEFDVSVLDADRAALGDEAVRGFVETFLREGPRLLGDIEAAAPDEVRARAHALKGAAASVGLSGLAAAARAVEEGDDAGGLRARLDDGMRLLRDYADSTSSPNR